MRNVSTESDADGVLHVVLRGELDFTNASQVAAGVREAISARRPTLVHVDLAAVTFLDSSGIGMLVQAMRAAEEVPAGFRVGNPTGNVFDQLHMAGLLDVFGVTEPAPDQP